MIRRSAVSKWYGQRVEVRRSRADGGHAAAESSDELLASALDDDPNPK